MNAVLTTAARAGFIQCHACHLLSQSVSAPPGHHACCPRCGAPLHPRKPNSLTRAWALTLTAFILYIPANVLPIMTVVSMGQGEPDTILSGVVLLIASGMWPIALVVFVASIAVPMLKLIVLTYLLLSVQRRSRWRPRDRTVMYRLTEAVGRWSMIDIFMISILIALINLGNIATIEVGPGAIAFGTVVVVTMFAAMSFDPRLIWDVIDKPYEPHS